MYQLTDTDKKIVDRTARVFNMRLHVFEEAESTDTLVDINGTHSVDRMDDGKFLVCAITVIPGVRYHSDGSGTPDDVDVTELTTHDRFIDAFAEAIGLAAKYGAFEIAEGVREDEEMESYRRRFPEEA